MDLAKTYVSEGKGTPELDELSEIMIHGYSLMGTVSGTFGSVEVEARELVVPARQIVSQSVRIEMTSGDEYPQRAVASIHYKNIEKFLLVLDKLQSTNIKQDRFLFTEVQFELDDLKIIVFNNDRGALMWALSAEGVSIHFSSLSTIGKLKELIEQARFHLDNTKI